MKKREPHTFPTVCRHLTGTVAAALLLVACSDDPTREAGPGGHTLRFEVSETAGWNELPAGSAAAPATSSAAAAACSGHESPVGCFTLRGETPADTLFVHASVAEGITARMGDGEHAVAETPESPNGQQPAAQRTVSAAEGLPPATRAAPVDEATFHDSFGVVAFAYKGAWDEALTPEYMYDVEVTRASGWTTRVYWPEEEQNVRFFAYAPYGGRGIALSEREQPGTPTIAYTVPEAVEEQQDLLVAVSDEMTGEGPGAAPLAFGHVLTAVRFVTGDGMLSGRIERIALKGVYGHAELTLGDAAWSGHGAETDFVQTLSATSDGSAGEPITPAEATFMMLPQTLPADALIEVVFTDDLTQTRRILTAQIGGGEWPAGKTVVYRLSTSSIRIDATFDVFPARPLPYNGDSRMCRVESWASVSRPNDTPQKVRVGWTCEFVEEDGAGGYRPIPSPEWVTMTFSPDNKVASYHVIIEPQDSVIVNPHDDALRAAPSINTATGRTPYNLANDMGAEGVQFTANCYVVNAPGRYSLPLVYGNAIKLGRTNRDAYYRAASGDKKEYACVNHLDSVITDPYIYRNANCAPADCCLVWQDAEGLVSDVQLSSDGQWLEFEVPEASIRQGNAVVAVRDAAQRIMWSWHIWVTDYKPGEGLKWVTNPQTGPAHFMPINIGWCEADIIRYEGRSTLLRFRQNDTQQTRIVPIVQLPHEVYGIGNCTLFEYGRKDPIRPVVIDANGIIEDKEWYSDTGYTYQTNDETYQPSDEKVTVGTVIQHPHIHYGTNTWTRTLCTPWNMIYGYYKYTYIKSVYDPTPAGYRVPLNQELSFITENGYDFNRTEYSGFTPHINSLFESVEDVKARWGWEFFCYRMKGQGDYDPAGGTIFLPLIGMRNLYGKKDSRGPYANIGGSDTYPFPQIDLEEIYMLNSATSPSRMFCIRPVKE